MDQAVRIGDLKRVQELIRNGADVNGSYEDSPLLHLAIKKGHVDSALALLAAGADIRTREGCRWVDSSSLGLFGGERKRRASAH